MVDQQLNQLGQTLLQQRQMQQTGQYQQAELKYRQLAEQAAVNRYEAAQHHYDAMEKIGASNEDARNKNAAAELDFRQKELAQRDTAQSQGANQQDLQNKQQMLQSVIALNATGQLDDDARNDVNSWLSDDEHFGPTGIQISKPDPSLAKTAGKDAAVVNALKQAQAYRLAASQATDPDDAKQNGDYAAMLEKYVAKAGTGATFTPTQTQVQRNAMGQVTNTLRTAISPPGAVGVPNSGTGGGANAWPAAPQDPAQRVPGQRYSSPSGTSATWTGQGWDTSAPTVQVPGLGAAQAPQ